MADDHDEFVWRVASHLKAIALSRGRDPFTLAVEALIAIDPAGMRQWADAGFPAIVTQSPLTETSAE